ncbi:glycosyltransferase family 1 protein [Occultella glacieicola]|uniref:glycosyltransferase family 1 protein n=1 Tax=Occultella glacieicola TaxID=2518684 RepID=UPI0010542E38|nr:glycosyltransferase family 1 protein [Occultella glacieicola]
MGGPDDGDEGRPAVPDTAVRLFVGPANFAGQGYLWARAVERSVPDVSAVSFAPHVPGAFDFPVDYLVPQATYLDDFEFHERLLAYVRGQFTHVLFEAARPLFGRSYGLNFLTESKLLTRAGLAVAVIAHGTDVRLPSRHAAAYDYSPFRGDLVPETPLLEDRAARNIARIDAFSGPAFVSTPDLLLDLPEATWCPVVVDVDRWHTDVPPMQRKVPVVVHAPSKSHVKGTDLVETALADLVARGAIEYRRIEGVPAAEMTRVYTEADIVLDQFRLGSYGVAACEAMAAGRVVVGNVSDLVREHATSVGAGELPIIQADGSDLASVIESIIDDPTTARTRAADGLGYVRAVHDGSISAGILRNFLEEGQQ